MKKMMKAILAGAILFSAVLGMGEVTTAAAAKPANTTAPIVRDNLSAFGLKKDIELPVTVTANGFSYTLEKIMIMETKSAAAQALIKKYNYWINEKYFIWTKITLENKGLNEVKRNSKDMSHKWRLSLGGENTLLTIMPEITASILNSKDALWSWSLKPGEKLNTYQAFSYEGDFNYFYIGAKVKNLSEYKDIVLPVN